jgi:hypothetical protein
VRDLSSPEPFEGASAPNEALKSLLSKGSARGSLEILFKFGRCSVSEGDGGFDVPWPMLGRMWHLTGVVPSEPIVEVIRQANVEAFRSKLALEDVNVGEVSGVHF